MKTTRRVLAILMVALPCFAQLPAHLQEFGIPGGITCQLPVEWMVDARQIDAIPDAEASRPRVLFSAHPMMRIGPSRNGEQESFTVSRWPAPTDPVAAFDAARDPLDMSETFALRQALALEGFTIAKAWTTATEQGQTQVVASTFLGNFAKGYPWVVETTTWHAGDVIYAAQLRYPEQVYDRYRHYVTDIKNGVGFNALSVPAFASGYTPAEPTTGAASRSPSLAMSHPPMSSFAPPSPVAPTLPMSPVGAVTVPGVVSSNTLMAESREAGRILHETSGSLALVEGKDKSGSAFVCNLGKQKFLVTNAHVLAGNTGVNIRMSDRAPLQLGAAASAVNHDLIRVAVTSTTIPALELLDNIPANLAVGDTVLVLGNAEGAHVINSVTGHVVGIGPDLIEVDAPFVPGHSGSPIIQERTGKLVGVATYAIVRELQTLADGPKEMKVRRFGYRLDSVQAWQAINWPKFNAEAAGIAQARELTLDLARLWKSIAGSAGPLQPAQNAGLRRAEIEYAQAVTAHQSSSADLGNARRSFLFTVRSLCKSDLDGLRPTLTYDYFQRQGNEEQEIRDEFAKVFNQLFNNQTDGNSNWRNGLQLR